MIFYWEVSMSTTFSMFYSIKGFIFTVCFYYIYIRFCHIVPSKRKMTVLILVSMYSGIAEEAIGLIDWNFSGFCLLFLTMTTPFVLFKNKFSTTLYYAVISYAIITVINVVAMLVFIALPTTYLLLELQKMHHQTILQQLGNRLCVGALHILFTWLFFRIKRFKVLYSQISDCSGNLFFYVCLFITIFSNGISHMDIDSDIDEYIGVLFLIILLGCIVIWTKFIDMLYQQKLKQRENERMYQNIEEQKRQLAFYSKSNDELSAIIHKDNKVLPAMTGAVRAVLSGQTADKQQTAQLLAQLDSLFADRETAVNNYEQQSISLSMTGILSFDAVVNWFQKRCVQEGVSFLFVHRTDLHELTENILAESDLHTLIADLCENALNAVKNCEKKNILLSVGKQDGNIFVSVYDSGISFTQKTLCNIGISRYTTHRKTGGSGIGMMTAFEIMKKCKASFELDEALPAENYTKKVSVVFDEKDKFYIHTDRKQLRVVSSYRNNVVFT